MSDINKTYNYSKSFSFISKYEHYCNKNRCRFACNTTVHTFQTDQRLQEFSQFRRKQINHTIGSLNMFIILTHRDRANLQYLEVSSYYSYRRRHIICTGEIKRNLQDVRHNPNSDQSIAYHKDFSKTDEVLPDSQSRDSVGLGRYIKSCKSR